MSHRKPRIEVVEQLASDTLDAMESCGIEDVTPAEILSASFTVTRKITKVMLSVEDPKDLEHNAEVITDAIADLYSLVPQKTIH